MANTCHHNCLEEPSDEHKKILGKLEELEKSAEGTEIDEEKIKEFLDFTENFAEPHHQKEENVLYPMAKDILTKEELEKLGHQCEKLKTKN